MFHIDISARPMRNFIKIIFFIKFRKVKVKKKLNKNNTFIKVAFQF